MLGKNYDLGERFYHEHQTFVSMARNAFPTLDMYRPS
jgi:hypothetical protein